MLSTAMANFFPFSSVHGCNSINTLLLSNEKLDIYQVWVGSEVFFCCSRVASADGEVCQDGKTAFEFPSQVQWLALKTIIYLYCARLLVRSSCKNLHFAFTYSQLTTIPTGDLRYLLHSLLFLTRFPQQSCHGRRDVYPAPSLLGLYPSFALISFVNLKHSARL